MGVTLVVFVWALMTGMFGRIVLVATGSSPGTPRSRRRLADDPRRAHDAAPHRRLLARARACRGVVYPTRLHHRPAGRRGSRPGRAGARNSDRNPNATSPTGAAGWWPAWWLGPARWSSGPSSPGCSTSGVDTRLVLHRRPRRDGGRAGFGARRAEVGILATGDPGLDEQTAIVSTALAQRLLGVAEAHEIALLVDRPPGDQAAIEEAVILAAPASPSSPGEAISRMVAQALAMQGVFLGSLRGHHLLPAGATGIVNTVAMSLAERTGDSACCGPSARPGRLAGSSWPRRGWLGASAPCRGLIGAATGWLGAVGLDLGATSAYGVRFTLYPHLSVAVTAGVAALFVALTMLTAGLAAWRGGPHSPRQRPAAVGEPDDRRRSAAQLVEAEIERHYTTKSRHGARLDEGGSGRRGRRVLAIAGPRLRQVGLPLNLIRALDTPTGGRLVVDGQPPRPGPSPSCAGTASASSSGHHNLVPVLTALEDVEYVMLQGRPEAARRQRLKSWRR
ncbi:MAG: hypothetical protein R3F43_02730 [bacterium]